MASGANGFIKKPDGADGVDGAVGGFEGRWSTRGMQMPDVRILDENGRRWPIHGGARSGVFRNRSAFVSSRGRAVAPRRGGRSEDGALTEQHPPVSKWEARGSAALRVAGALGRWFPGYGLTEEIPLNPTKSQWSAAQEHSAPNCPHSSAGVSQGLRFSIPQHPTFSEEAAPVRARRPVTSPAAINHQLSTIN